MNRIVVILIFKVLANYGQAQELLSFSVPFANQQLSVSTLNNINYGLITQQNQSVEFFSVHYLKRNNWGAELSFGINKLKQRTKGFDFVDENILADLTDAKGKRVFTLGNSIYSRYWVPNDDQTVIGFAFIDLFGFKSFSINKNEFILGLGLRRLIPENGRYRSHIEQTFLTDEGRLYLLTYNSVFNPYSIYIKTGIEIYKGKHFNLSLNANFQFVSYNFQGISVDRLSGFYKRTVAEFTSDNEYNLMFGGQFKIRYCLNTHPTNDLSFLKTIRKAILRF